jgi:hypothetical protein
MELGSFGAGVDTNLMFRRQPARSVMHYKNRYDSKKLIGSAAIPGTF